MNTLIETLSFYREIPGVRAVAIVVASIVLALVVKFVVIRLLISLTRKTKTELDDRVVSALRFPLFISVILLGLSYAAYDLELNENALYYVLGVLKTAAVLIWGQAAMHIGSVFLQLLSRLTDRVQFIQPSSLPLFEIVVKVAVVVAFGYFFMAAWGINVTGWLASAGILGIAIGFAAKDTLANLFAGIFILTDAPYRIGDFIVLGNNRGMVTHIGIRSTRILTRDDIEITIPNASIANSQIINETAGRHEKIRIRITVPVAYDSDVQQVRRILLSCVEGVDHIACEPVPSVRFTEFGDSGLIFQLRAWVLEPVYMGRVNDQLNTSVYNALKEAGIEIPYSKHDVFIKQMS
jgi:MscS family membrane protein